MSAGQYIRIHKMPPNLEQNDSIVISSDNLPTLPEPSENRQSSLEGALL